MKAEKANNICQQLELIGNFDFIEQDGSKIHPLVKFYREIFLSTLKPPDETAEELCQYIKDNRLEKVKGFAFSVYRMLQTKQINKQGLEKIIKTFKKHYQID